MRLMTCSVFLVQSYYFIIQSPGGGTKGDFSMNFGKSPFFNLKNDLVRVIQDARSATPK